MTFDSAGAQPSVSGGFARGLLALADDSLNVGQACDVRSAELRADLADVAVSYPGTLAAGMQWRDSLSSTSCISGFPARVTSHRVFRVEGDTTIAGANAVILSRRDTLSAAAEGTLDRHRASVSADGGALARIYVSAERGEALLVRKALVLNVAVKTAGRAGVFVERVESTFQLETAR